MNVDVHGLRGNSEEEDRQWKATARENVAIGLAHGVSEQLVPNGSTIDIKMNRVAVGAAGFGTRDIGLYVSRALFPLDADQGTRLAFTEDRRDPFSGIRCLRPDHRFAIIALDFEAGRREGHGKASQPVDGMAPLGSGLLEKFAPGWNPAKKVGDFDPGSLRTAGFALHDNFAGLDANFMARRSPGQAGQQPHARHRGDGGERFAPEAKTYDSSEVVKGRDLARGMTAQGHPRFLGFHPGSIVGDRYQARPAVSYFDPDTPSPGVEGILHKFFEHRRGSLDDLSCCDLVHEFAGQKAHSAVSGCFFSCRASATHVSPLFLSPNAPSAG